MRAPHAYNCCICHRDVRIRGGRSDETSAMCNECLSRTTGRSISVQRDCDLCGFHTALTVARIMEYDEFRMEEGNLIPPSNAQSELYEICNTCKEKLHDRDFFQMITRHKCEYCRVRFGVLNAVFNFAHINPRRMRICPRCLPGVKRQMEELSTEMSQRYSHSPGTVSPNVWDGVIEFKNDDCFIWDPVNITMRRNYGTSNSFFEVTIQGRDMDESYFRGRHNINRAFIYDRDTIFILHGAELQGARDPYAGIFGADERRSGASGYRPPSLQLNFLCKKIEIRAVEAERHRQEQQRPRTLEGNTGLFIDSAAQASGSDWDYQIEAGRILNGDTQSFPDITQARSALANARITGVTFSHPYNDPEGRIFVWCSCGFMKQIPPTQQTLTHAGNTVVIQSHMYSPGGQQSSMFPGHTIHMQSPEVRDELQ